MLQSTIASLVLTKVSGATRATAEQPLTIHGRAAGAVGWIFTKLGLSDRIALELHPQEIRLLLGSLQGVVNVCVPLTQVASTSCSYSKPIWALVISGCLALLGVFELVGNASLLEKLGPFVFAALTAVWYVLNKSLRITIQTSAGSSYGISVKRSVIEGVALDFADATFVVERLNAAVVQATARQRALSRAA